MQFGGALGLAVLSALATDRSNRVLQAGGDLPGALTAGFQRAFLIGACLVLAAALIAFTAINARPREGTAPREPMLNAVSEEA